jgi:hypothetical protein
MFLLFVQCEKEEIILNEEDQLTFAADIIQDTNAKKPDNPGIPADDPTDLEYVVITGDVQGEGEASTSVREYAPFTLTIGDRFFEEDVGTFEGEIRILYGTKKKSENRIDFHYTDDGVDKAFIIWAEPNTGAYDESTGIMTLDNCHAIIAIRDGTGDNYTDYTPSSATVVFSD